MIVTLNDLADIRTRHEDERVILTSGTFDLFHVGHLHYLQAVKTYGDIVTVLLSGDARVQARKGSERPVIRENDRAEILDALKVVDYVFIDPGTPGNEADPIYADILASLQPDLYVTDGEDIRFSKIMDESQLIILPRTAGGTHDSTTDIMNYIASLRRADEQRT